MGGCGGGGVAGTVEFMSSHSWRHGRQGGEDGENVRLLRTTEGRIPCDCSVASVWFWYGVNVSVPACWVLCTPPGLPLHTCSRCKLWRQITAHPCLCKCLSANKDGTAGRDGQMVVF